MPDDYPWSKTGAPDPETERPERLLSRYRHRARSARPGCVLAPLALAACLLLTLSQVWLVSRDAGVRWTLVAGGDQSRGAGTGEWIETGAEAATLRISGGDEIRVEPTPGSAWKTRATRPAASAWSAAKSPPLFTLRLELFSLTHRRHRRSTSAASMSWRSMNTGTVCCAWSSAGSVSSIGAGKSSFRSMLIAEPA
jgi:hypothetical protein